MVEVELRQGGEYVGAKIYEMRAQMNLPPFRFGL